MCLGRLKRRIDGELRKGKEGLKSSDGGYEDSQREERILPSPKGNSQITISNRKL